MFDASSEAREGRPCTSELRTDWRRAIWSAECVIRFALQADIICCNTAASGLAKAKQWQKGLLLLRRVRLQALRLDLASYNTAINLYRASDWQSSLDVLAALEQRNLEATLVSRGTLAACGRWRISIQQLERSSMANMRLINAASSAAGRTEQWETALLMLSEAALRLVETTDASYTVGLTLGHGRHSSWQRSCGLMKGIGERNLRTSVITFNAAISSIKEQWNLALFLLFSLSHLQLADVVTCTSALNACQKASQWQWAFQHCQHRQRSSCTATCNVAIKAISSCSETMWPTAVEIYRCLRATRSADILTLGSTISTCAGAVCWGISIALLDDLEGPSPLSAGTSEHVAVSSAISACEKTGRWQAALHLLHRLRARSHADGIAHNAAISACGGCSKWEESLSLLEQLHSSQLRMDIVSLNAAITTCDRASQWQRSLLLLFGMSSLRLQANTVSYNAAISACAASLSWQCALCLLADLHESEGLQQDIVTYSGSMSACIRAGRWEKALAIFEDGHEIHESGQNVSFNSAVAACNGGGLWQAALQIIVSGVQTDVMSYNAASSTCGAVLKWKEPLFLLAKLRGEGLADDITYSAFAAAADAAMKWQWAMLLMPELKSTLPERPWAFAALISTFAKSFCWSQALSTTQHAEEIGLDMFESYEALLSAFSRAYVWQQALCLVASFEARSLLANVLFYKAASEFFSTCHRLRTAEFLAKVEAESTFGLQRKAVALGKKRGAFVFRRVGDGLRGHVWWSTFAS